ncbi:MAG: efflux RND transporter periplasmic adaptor subunit, partial [Planctomycetaceae bacterium]|nr:efflux RND transporter periplasmic adaptor subunit [Planctomycetaceae bacterium]
IDEHEHEGELRLSNRPLGQVMLVDNAPASAPLLVVDQLDVHKGQAVNAGETLCQLVDLSRLYIEGHAFEQDAAALSHAAEQGWTITAILGDPADGNVVEGLRLAYLGNSVDRESRTLPFYVDLLNEVVRDTENGDHQRFITWRYRPGQRMQLEVPIEEWTDQIVLPVDAAVQEGADWFVFQQNGKRFDRIAVHVRHRDQRSVVVANDGSLFPGDVVALKSAHQMQMAIRNQSGGAVDPHAGHNH